MSNERTVEPRRTPRLREGVRAWLVHLFGSPAGFWGGVVGRVMAWRPSNRRRNAWTVDRLGLKPGERVLEIGFGPGLALERAARLVGGTGLVAGIDRSAVMVRQALRRNAEAVASRRMDLRTGCIEALPDFGGRFDAILSVNSIGFWRDPPAALRALRERLAPGGRLAITVQPRTKGATAATSASTAQGLEVALRGAGFRDVRRETLDLDPPAVCVIGRP